MIFSELYLSIDWLRHICYWLIRNTRWPFPVLFRRVCFRLGNMSRISKKYFTRRLCCVLKYFPHIVERLVKMGMLLLSRFLRPIQENLASGWCGPTWSHCRQYLWMSKTQRHTRSIEKKLGRTQNLKKLKITKKLKFQKSLGISCTVRAVPHSIASLGRVLIVAIK